MTFLVWFFQVRAGSEWGAILQKAGVLGWVAFFWQFYLQQVHLHDNPVFIVFTILWIFDMILGSSLAVYNGVVWGREVRRLEGLLISDPTNPDLILKLAKAKANHTALAFDGRKTFRGFLKWGFCSMMLIASWAFLYDGLVFDDIIPVFIQSGVIFHVGMSLLQNSVDVMRVLAPESDDVYWWEKIRDMFRSKGKSFIDAATSSEVILSKLEDLTKNNCSNCRNYQPKGECCNEPNGPDTKKSDPGPARTDTTNTDLL